MFYSIDLLTLKPDLAVVWLAGTMGGTKRQLKSISKQEILKVNLITACESISQPQLPLSIRFSGSLLLGIVRVQFRKTELLLSDVTQTYQTITSIITNLIETELKGHQLLAPLNSITLPDRPAFEIWVELVNDTIPPIQPVQSNLDWSIISPELIRTVGYEDISIPRDESEAFREFIRESPSQLFPLDDFRGEIGTSFNFDDLEPIPEISGLRGVDLEPTLPKEIQFVTRQLTPLLERPSLEATIPSVIRPYKKPRFDVKTELSPDEMDPNRTSLWDEFYGQWSIEHTKKLAKLQYQQVSNAMFANPGPIEFIPNLQNLWETSLQTLIIEPNITEMPTMEREELPSYSPPPQIISPTSPSRLEVPEAIMLPWEMSPLEPLVFTPHTISSPSQISSRVSPIPVSPQLPRGLSPKDQFYQFLLLQTTTDKPLIFQDILGEEPTRHVIVSAFLLLLGLESDQQINTYQVKPYEKISIQIKQVI